VLGLTWLRGLVMRRAGRLAGTAGGVAIAVALLASIGTFLVSSKATMTKRAVDKAAIDWQVEGQPGADARALDTTVARYGGVRSAQPFEIATTSGLQATAGSTTQATGAGVVVGVPSGYRTTFPGVIRPLTGNADGVVVAQQTAANLHAAPGDMVTIARAGAGPLTVRVDGVVDLPVADSLFQKVGAPAGAQPQAPPDNIVILPAQQWYQAFDEAAATGGQVRHQLHLRLDHHLPADPAAAYAAVTGQARNLELKLAGSGLVGDNLGATLAGARQDALYAQVLFLFLGAPGAVLAGLLTAAVAGAGAERRRREQALLRTRGADRAQLVKLGLVEAVAVGTVGSVMGLAVAVGLGRVALHGANLTTTSTTAVVVDAMAAAVGLAIAGLSLALPAWRDARAATVVAGRRSAVRSREPRWMRYQLDLLLLVAAGAVFWVTSRNGYQLVLAVEGVPTISVSYWAFAGPALLWAGCGLLAWRLANLVLRRGRRALGSALRPLAGGLADTVAASMGRQRRLLAQGVALIALTATFAGSTAVFNATYQRQAEADAALSNGADITVTQSPGSNVGPERAAGLAKVAGVRSVEPIQHRFAYVGADLQDLFGVRPTSIVGATKLQSAYFQGGSARALMSQLAQRPDGILVSAETVKDFQLTRGDLVRLRLQDARTHQLLEVPFHYLGIAKEFPTAPKDSFLVANASYVAQRTGSTAVGAFLVDAGGTNLGAVANRVRAHVGTSATVTDIATSRKVVGSSLTAVDLAGLTRVELGFALLLAAAATGLVLWLGFAERRRSFAVASALGASSRQVAGFVWGEALFVGGAGLVGGAVGGWALSEMLVKVLTGVFDPPPSALAVPWRYLAVLTVLASVALAAAALAAVRAARRSPVQVLREA